MKRKILIYLIIILFPIEIYAKEPEINSNHAILYNLNDNTILYEKNSEEKTSIASLTKIMTSIIVLEQIKNLDEKVTITEEDYQGLREQNAATAGFQIGEEVTYKDLLYGLMLPSGAEAAKSLCRNTFQTEKNCIQKMNEKAKELNLKNTHFENPTGLDDENHYSTVKDTLMLWKYALQNSSFLEIINKKAYTTSNKNHTFKSTIARTMEKYNIQMDYIIGGKTGTTENAGLSLATIAEKNKIKYLLVTTQAPYNQQKPYHFEDAKNLYEYFMNNYGYHIIYKKGEKLVTLKTKYIKEKAITFKTSKKKKIYLPNTFKKEELVYKYTGKKVITHKMKKGENIGKVIIYYNDKPIDTINIILNKKQRFSIIRYLQQNKDYKKTIIYAIILYLAVNIIKRLFLKTTKK